MDTPGTGGTGPSPLPSGGLGPVSDPGKMLQSAVEGAAGKVVGAENAAAVGKAADWAKKGTAIGGPVGTAVGAGAGLLATKKGRRWLIIGIATPPVTFLALVLALVMIVSSVVTGAHQGQHNDTAMLAYSADMSGDDARLFQEVATEYGVPWEVLAAIPFVEGNDISTGDGTVDGGDGGTDPSTSASATGTPAPTSTASSGSTTTGLDTNPADGIGPYGLDMAKARAFLGASTPLTLAEANTAETSMRIVARALAAAMADQDISDTPIDSGAIDAPEADGQTVAPSSGASGSSALSTQPSTGAAAGAAEIIPSADQDSNGAALAAATHKAYVAAIGELPIKNIDGMAERVYTVALAWALGGSARCAAGVMPGTLTTVSTPPSTTSTPSTSPSTGPGHAHASGASTPTSGATSPSPSSTGTTGSPAPAGGLPTTLSGTVTEHNGSQATVTLNEKQIQNASLVIQAAYAAGLDDNAAIIGLMVGLDESTLRNLANPFVPESLLLPNDGTGTDHDSVGVFQQRAIFDGGHTVAERMNVSTSASLFYQVLAGITGWQTMTKDVAAQTVQRSATPTAYAGFEAFATQILAAIKGIPYIGSTAGTVTGCGGSGNGASFVMGELNVLQADRTDCSFGPGSMCQYPNWPKAEVRYAAEVAAINKVGATVMALQEFNPQGYKIMQAALGSGWTLYGKPSNTNDSAIAWRNDTWTMADQGLIATTWYRGSTNKLPWALLQNVATGQQIILMSAHTLVTGLWGSTVADQHKAFDQIAAAWKSTFATKYAGVPVIMGGDFNNDSMPCYFDSRAGAVDSAGTTGDLSNCQVPSTHHDPTEWTESTPDVTWSGYTDDNSLNGHTDGVAVKATDHDFDYATATIGGRGTGGGVIIGQGKGSFTDTGQVVGSYTPAQLETRAGQYANHTSGWLDNGAHGTYYTTADYEEGNCQHFTANFSGYASSNAPNRTWAIDLWNWYVSHGLAHAASAADGMSPAIGAQLYFDTGANKPGHVVVYLGANRVISTDTAPDGSYSSGHVSVVSMDTFWARNDTYLGWAPPTFP